MNSSHGPGLDSWARSTSGATRSPSYEHCHRNLGRPSHGPPSSSRSVREPHPILETVTSRRRPCEESQTCIVSRWARTGILPVTEESITYGGRESTSFGFGTVIRRRIGAFVRIWAGCCPSLNTPTCDLGGACPTRGKDLTSPHLGEGLPLARRRPRSHPGTHDKRKANPTSAAVIVWLVAPRTRLESSSAGLLMSCLSAGSGSKGFGFGRPKGCKRTLGHFGDRCGQLL